METREGQVRGGRRTTGQFDIVVGIDESPTSGAALRWAADLSLVTGLPLRLVHAWQMNAEEQALATARGAGYVEAAAAHARARVTRWVLDTLGGDAARLHWTLIVQRGRPGPVLVRTSRGARLVVVGTQEHIGSGRSVSGAVAHLVLSHADVPVVTVPALVGEPPDELLRESAVMGLRSPPVLKGGAP